MNKASTKLEKDIQANQKAWQPNFKSGKTKGNRMKKAGESWMKYTKIKEAQVAA